MTTQLKIILYIRPVNLFKKIWHWYICWYSPCLYSNILYRLLSNIRCTSNIRRAPTFGNSQLQFSPTISSSKTSQYKTLECRLSTKCELPHGPSCSEWPAILTHRGSQDQWHLISLWRMWGILAPAANLCTPSVIIFVSIKARIWRYLRWYIDGSAILLTVKYPYDTDD